MPAARESAPLGTPADAEVIAPPTKALNERASRLNADLEKLKMEYDSLLARYISVERSIQQRAKNIDNLKPEIASALTMAKADLASAERALAHADQAAALKRLERLRSTMDFLESL